MEIETERLRLRKWEERDRGAFFRLNSDPTIMEFFGVRRSRKEADARMDEWREQIAATGFGFGAMELKQTGQAVGIAGLHVTTNVPAFPAGAMEIGWRLVPELWGNGLATEAARALLDHAFGRLGQARVIAMAVWNNERSVAVMRRLGMRHLQGADFDHPVVPDDAPHLKRHVVFGIEARQWADRGKAAR
ncbi:MAG TPA: GNAT family N-acetyltransferase [Mesorhizobium sp.]|jgi:RimJ/RimL family protein N-acetyltransferase|nr:GNAT family N-acetyltransferase [Mesorhizobium sp.]